MKTRLLGLVAVVALFAVACDSDDAELSTSSTILTGGTNAPATTTTTEPTDDATDGTSSPTTLVGEVVTDADVVARIPNDNGEERHYVIPNGAYTDVDLTNFIIELLEADSELYGAQVFDNAAAAEAFQVDEANRSDEENALLERHHFLTLEGRDRIIFRGPFSESPGGAIGS